MIYVGKHITNNINDSYMGSGLRIRRAIEKYGLENFEKTILFECKSEEEMNAKEAEIVNEDFIARDDVYNIKLGGDGGWDYLNSTGLNHSGKFRNDLITESLYKFIQRYGKSPIAKRLEMLKILNPEKYNEYC
jgi:hypothetical protein